MPFLKPKQFAERFEKVFRPNPDAPIQDSVLYNEIIHEAMKAFVEADKATILGVVQKYDHGLVWHYLRRFVDAVYPNSSLFTRETLNGLLAERRKKANVEVQREDGQGRDGDSRGSKASSDDEVQATTIGVETATGPKEIEKGTSKVNLHGLITELGQFASSGCASLDDTQLFSLSIRFNTKKKKIKKIFEQVLAKVAVNMSPCGSSVVLPPKTSKLPPTPPKSLTPSKLVQSNNDDQPPTPSKIQRSVQNPFAIVPKADLCLKKDAAQITGEISAKRPFLAIGPTEVSEPLPKMAQSNNDDQPPTPPKIQRSVQNPFAFVPKADLCLKKDAAQITGEISAKRPFLAIGPTEVSEPLPKMQSVSTSSSCFYKPVVPRRKWTAEEDALLEDGIFRFGLNWVKIASRFNNSGFERNNNQCRDRVKSLRKMKKM